jgi:hypothetical protein
MVKISWRLLFILIFLFQAKPSELFAQGAGTTGADLLKTPVGVRPAALGGAYAALGDDVYVIGFNPAGLARVSKYSLGLDDIQGFANVETDSISVAVPTKSYGNIGVQLIYRQMPTIANALATDPPVNASDYLLTIADGQQFGAVAVGGSLKTLYSMLGNESAFVEAVDFGIKLQLLETDVALVAQNIGPAVQYQPGDGAQDPLPLTLRLALSRPLIVTPSSTLLASIEGFYVQGEGDQSSIGVEYWHRSILALRVGYRFSDPNNLSGGFSAGAGLRYNLGKLEYELGYAWRPSQISSSFIASTHLFGLLFWY